MRLSVQLFATLKDRARAGRLQVSLPDSVATVSDLLDRLATDVPGLAPSLPAVIVAVNHEFAFRDQRLTAGDEVALFPPVSGG